MVTNRMKNFFGHWGNTTYALSVAGIIFALIALIHAYRILFFFPVMMGTHSVSIGASFIAFIIFGLLSAWMFFSAWKA